MTSIQFLVSGMSCTGCAQSIERRLKMMPGVHSVSVDYTAGTADITYDEQVVDPATLEKIITTLGFEVIIEAGQRKAE